MHLTNIAVQKNQDDYGKYEDGNIMSLEEYQKELWKQDEEKEAAKKRAQKAKLERLKNNPLLQGLYQKELDKSREELEKIKNKTQERESFVRDSLYP